MQKVDLVICNDEMKKEENREKIYLKLVKDPSGSIMLVSKTEGTNYWLDEAVITNSCRIGLVGNGNFEIF